MNFINSNILGQRYLHKCNSIKLHYKCFIGNQQTKLMEIKEHNNI